jgi:hypothetical protein
MKQYDKIWVPEKKQGFAMRDKEGDTPCILSGPVIVLTIEELSELWNAGYRAARADLGMETKLPALGFEAYSQSKGIDL